ncbi:MAG: YkgJ family cysteine cluster protein [Thermoplasmatota archaeon]
MSSRYTNPAGLLDPGWSDPPAFAAKKERLFARLDAVYAKLEALNKLHNATPYGCDQTGSCCQVGLVLHTMEAEHLARSLRAMPARKRDFFLAQLEKATRDEFWTATEQVSAGMCAFYDLGCQIHPDRPAICRMYGVILELNDDCPRTRLASGKEYLYVGPEVDALVREFYSVVDDYGKLFPRLDHSQHVAAGVLPFFRTKTEIATLRRGTKPKFWKTTYGYRSSFVPSGRRGKKEMQARRNARAVEPRGVRVALGGRLEWGAPGSKA